MKIRLTKVFLKTIGISFFIAFSIFAGIRQEIIITPDGYAYAKLYDKLKDGENYYRNYRIYKYSLSKNTGSSSKFVGRKRHPNTVTD